MSEEKKHITNPENYSEPRYVHLGKKMAVIKPIEWDYNFDPDTIFKIDPFNIFGEIITIPVLVNRMGVLAAELKSYVKRKKLDLELKEAKVRKIFRQGKDKKPTIQEVDDHLLSDVSIRDLRLKLLRLEEDLTKVESFYESAKQKGFLLNNVSKNLKPEDFEKEFVDGVVNGVLVNLKNKRYSNGR